MTQLLLAAWLDEDTIPDGRMRVIRGYAIRDRRDAPNLPGNRVAQVSGRGELKDRPW